MLVVSSNTVTAAVPRPRQPTLPGPLKSSGVSNSFSVMHAHADAARNAALGLATLPHAAAVLVDQLPATSLPAAVRRSRACSHGR